MFLLRGVRLDDMEAIYRLAKMLNSINLPDNRKILNKLITISMKSFGSELADRYDGRYLFVLEDTESGEVIASSQIIARYGTKENPNSFFKLNYREKYCTSADIRIQHRTLKLEFDQDGPTEIGGLILRPTYRNHPARLGKQISFVRFLFMAIHPESFKERIIAELLPPFNPNGTSPLWEAIGRKFTQIDYLEADRLSQESREFVTSLFPWEEIYVTLLPKEVQDVIGEVGPETKPVQHMLTQIGFKFLDMIDPFDGGPHYGAELKEIALIAKTAKERVEFVDHFENPAKTRLGMIGKEADKGFQAMQVSMLNREGKVWLRREDVAPMELSQGEMVWIMQY